MSFNLGSTNLNQQPQTTGFCGFGLSNTNLTANKPAFGSRAPVTGSLCGNTTQAPAFGTTTQPTSTGSLFGNTSGLGTLSTGLTGSLFGNSTTTLGTQPATIGFGTATSQPTLGFGTSTQTTAFGTATQPTNTGSLFGNTSGLGTTSARATGSLFGNITTTLGTQPKAGNFGTGVTIANLQPPTGFGTSTSAFNTGIGTTGFSLGSSQLFGQKPAITQSSLFSFNTPSINQSTAQSNLIAQQQQPQAQPQNHIDSMTFTPKLFNDDHDRILGEFNKTQAYWGYGKGYYAYNKPPTEFNQNQPLHKFKSIGFAEIKQTSDDDENKFGVLVRMQNEQQLNTSILPYEANLKSMFDMNFNVKVENCKLLPENKALLCISAVDINTNKKLPAFQLISFLNQAHIKQQLN